jgi:DUF1365 family protein
VIESGLYAGTVRHRRFRPAEHAFTYPVFFAWLDVDRIPELMARSWLTGYNRLRPASFHEADHLGDPSRSLRERLAADAAAAGHTLPSGPIYLLSHMRYFGYTFNPVSFFYCFEPDGRMPLVMAEVNNTFGETCNYWIPGDGGRIRATAEKKFHVSPFIEPDCRYDWEIGVPGRSLTVQLDVAHSGQPLLDCTLVLEHRPWSAGALVRALLRYPWMTVRVITAIHWQAVRLWLKGVPVVRHPGPGRFAPAPTKHFGASWSIE